MTTAISQLTAQPINRTTLLELLSSQGQAHENLGAGLREACICLEEARAFYDLPAARDSMASGVGTLGAFCHGQVAADLHQFGC
jgi:hypothetical protein